MKNIGAKLNISYLAVVVLFGLSLCFSFTREAHGLCVRLLLHLRGETFVQGNPPGCMIYTIPNVQFTEKHRQELRGRSASSLDDFALASTTGDYYKLTAPAASASWSNHPLLEWAALQLAWTSFQLYSDLNLTNLPATNTVALAAINNARQAILLAQKTCPTNGILWLADAAVYFTEKRNQEALAALQIAATNRNWSANSTAVFSCLNDLFKKAGLSELDAAAEAVDQMPELNALIIQNRCVNSLHQMMETSVESNDDQQFSMLFKLMVELRRAVRSDRGGFAVNNFRRDLNYDGLVNAMAKKMGVDQLPESEVFPIAKLRKMREQILQDYLTRYVDAQTVASFLTQAEDYKTEKELRSEIRQMRGRQVMWSGLFSSASGFMSLATLSLFGMALLFEIISSWLRKYSGQSGKLPRQKNFWIGAALVVVASTAVFANFCIGCGIGNEVGFGVTNPPLTKTIIQTSLVGLVFSMLWLGFLLDQVKNRVSSRPWLIVFCSALVYVICVFVMAYFRWDTIEKLTTGLF